MGAETGRGLETGQTKASDRSQAGRRGPQSGGRGWAPWPGARGTGCRAAAGRGRGLRPGVRGLPGPPARPARPPGRGSGAPGPRPTPSSRLGAPASQRPSHLLRAAAALAAPGSPAAAGTARARAHNSAPARLRRPHPPAPASCPPRTGGGARGGAPAARPIAG